MKTQIFAFLLLMISLLSSKVLAQNAFPTFKDGIFYTHSALKDNQPNISFDSLRQNTKHLRIIVKSDVSNPHRINQLSIKEGKKKKIKIDLQIIWAFCYNGILYLHHNGELVMVGKFGAISHFSVESIRFGPTDQTLAGYDNRQTSMGPQFAEKKHRSYQYLLDFESGEILPYDVQSLLQIFKRDSQLFNAFYQEPDKAKQSFRYLLEYNRRHPILLN